MKMFKAPLYKMKQFFKKYKENRKCCKALNAQIKELNKMIDDMNREKYS